MVQFGSRIFFFFFFASSVPDSLGVHLRATGHSEPIRSDVGYEWTNQMRVYSRGFSSEKSGFW